MSYQTDITNDGLKEPFFRTPITAGLVVAAGQPTDTKPKIYSPARSTTDLEAPDKDHQYRIRTVTITCNVAIDLTIHTATSTASPVFGLHAVPAGGGQFHIPDPGRAVGAKLPIYITAAATGGGNFNGLIELDLVEVPVGADQQGS